MNLPSERNSPMSSSEALSGSSSPQVLKLTTIPPQLKKQRSSSMNSVGSNQSTQHRSMSIISLELPSNSIVSLDDNFLRPTRNNSTASLSSLAPHVSPNDTVKDNYASHRISKFRLKNASSVMSDEESEPESVVSRFKWRRRSSDKVLKPTFLSSLKKDFKFKYDNHLVSKVSSSAPPARSIDDSTPSPLSLTTDASIYPGQHHPHNSHISQVGHHLSPHNFQDTDNDIHPSSARSLASGKKLRTSSITQSIFLKKRLLLSKDIQLELLGGHNAATSNTSASLHHEDSKFPALLLPTPLRGLIHNYLQLHFSEPHALSSPSTPLTQHTKSPSPPAAFSPPSVSQPTSPPREKSALRQQNKLISELNRKWNRAFFDEMKKPTDVRGPLELLSKKRMRSELVSSNDSYTTSSR